MAHQDDFEFTAGGLFALFCQKYGNNLKIKILATSRGASGHMDMSPDETFLRRNKEAEKSAALIGGEYECLSQLDGSYIEGQVLIDRNMLGGLWNSIRDFEADVVFCPPLASSPLAGIHIDHYNTAQAVRVIACQLNVPHAYPTMSGAIKKKFNKPMIFNVDDDFIETKHYHLCCDISPVYDIKAKMAACHQSQILEWLPFVSGYESPKSINEWKQNNFKQWHETVNGWHGKNDNKPREYFVVTSWGRHVSIEDIEFLFPKGTELHPDIENYTRSHPKTS